MPILPELKHYYLTQEWADARVRILRRANGLCEQCGDREGTSNARGSLVQLGVAHLNHDPANNSDSNLAALCRGCHLIHDKGKHKQTRSVRKDAARPLLREAS